MKLRPRNGRLVVQRSKPKEKTTSGLFIPDVAQESKDIGTVIVASPGSELNGGDKIHWMPFSGFEFQMDGQDYLMIEEADVLCVIEEEGL